MKRLALGLMLAGVVGSGSEVFADTMRCGQKLVADGDSTYHVRTRCGEPAARTARTEYRTARVWVAGRALEQTVEVQIEEWTYDFGPHRFMQHLTFEQGRLARVVSGHRGEEKPSEAM